MISNIHGSFKLNMTLVFKKHYPYGKQMVGAHILVPRIYWCLDIFVYFYTEYTVIVPNMNPFGHNMKDEFALQVVTQILSIT